MDFLDEFARKREAERRAQNAFPGRPAPEVELAIDRLMASVDSTAPRAGTIAIHTGLLAARMASRLVNSAVAQRTLDVFVAGSLCFAEPSQLRGPLERFRGAIAALDSTEPVGSSTAALTAEVVRVAKFFSESVYENEYERALTPREAIAQMKERPARFNPTHVAALELAIHRPGAPLVTERAATPA